MTPDTVINFCRCPKDQTYCSCKAWDRLSLCWVRALDILMEAIALYAEKRGVPVEHTGEVDLVDPLREELEFLFGRPVPVSVFMEAMGRLQVQRMLGTRDPQ